MPDIVRGKEFIRGNHDGPYGVDDTYTVCRLSVPRPQLVKEIDEDHLHPGYRVLHMRDRHGKVIDERPQKTPDSLAFTNVNHGDCPADPPARRLVQGGDGIPEYIHGHRDGTNRRNEHYTISRLGVPLETLVLEIREGLHPEFQFQVRRKNGDPEPEWKCGMVCPLRSA
jgi:hypothetical protein